MTKTVQAKLILNGYRKIIRTTEEDYRILYDATASMVNFVLLVDAKKYHSNKVESFKTSFIQLMKGQGYVIHPFTIVLVNGNDTDYFDQISVAKQVCSEDKFAWVYDEKDGSLIVYENQVEEFFGLRNALTNTEVTEEVLEQLTDIDNMGSSSENTKKTPKEVLRNLPKITIALIVLNILIYIVCSFTGELLYNKGGVGLALVETPDQWYRIVTSMFLHLTPAHVFNNMLLLYFIGELVEKKMGSIWYFAAYMISGIAGTFGTFISEKVTGEYVVVFGASGAVFGMWGVLFALVVFRRLAITNVTSSRVLFAIILSVVNGFTSENVANWSHLGGLLMGVVIGVIYCVLERHKESGY